MTIDIRSRIAQHYNKRLENPKNTGLKINLYRGYEVAGLAAALENDAFLRENALVESVMVADSFLMTHLHRPSTTLESKPAQALYLDIMVSMVAEVRAQMDRSFSGSDKPYVIADLPDGAGESFDVAHINTERLLDAGGDIVKIEVKSNECLKIVEGLSRVGIPIMAHIGYTPQGGTSKRIGRTADELLELFAMARRVRDAGACCLVIEKVSQFANQLLCNPNTKGIPLFSIFSGRAKFGGQSLNVWDAVYAPSFNATYFPPTGTLDVETYPESYTLERISDHLTRLMKLTIDGSFPLSPPVQQDAEEETLANVDPWSEAICPAADIAV